jgi:hypothetical protein
MKTRKSLEIVFPNSFYVTLFRWDGIARGYEMLEDHAAGKLVVKVQQRKERQRIAWTARYAYDAQVRTLVE